MVRERFCLSDQAGTILRENSSIGMLFGWLIEHRYFQEHPDTVLKLTEENTPKFSFDVTESTTSRDATAVWNKYNCYL